MNIGSRSTPINGFTLDDERLKQPAGADYFDELLAQIREIRASEAPVYQRIREIFALSCQHTRTMGRPVIQLRDLEGLALVVEYPSGVLYTNQAGGVFCNQPIVEGVLAPLGNECDVLKSSKRFLQRERYSCSLHTQMLWT